MIETIKVMMTQTIANRSIRLFKSRKYDLPPVFAQLLIDQEWATKEDGKTTPLQVSKGCNCGGKQ